MAAESKTMPEITLKHLEKAFDKQAVLINNAFEDQKNYIDQQAHKVGGRIDLLQDELKTDIHRVEAKVDKALYSEYVNLETRVKRVEHKLGLKPIN